MSDGLRPDDAVPERPAGGAVPELGTRAEGPPDAEPTEPATEAAGAEPTGAEPTSTEPTAADPPPTASTITEPATELAGTEPAGTVPGQGRRSKRLAAAPIRVVALPLRLALPRPGRRVGGGQPDARARDE